MLKRFGLQAGNYTLVTLHRPSNVDNKDKLWRILELLNNVSKRIPVIFPVHPRTRKKLDEFGSDLSFDGELRITEAFRYKEFIILEKKAKCVITDSGGIQEETTYLDIPCLTLRPNTERPVTITEGTNELVALEEIEEKMRLILSRNWKQGKIPALWDGKTAKRIVDVFEKIDFQNNDFTRF
jgi:UDP-N-acetylglucosamine 2-epimerase (non-hydrolysing)